MYLLRTEDAVYNLDLIKRIRVKVVDKIVKIDLDGEIEEVLTNSGDEAADLKDYLLDLLEALMSGFYEGRNVINLKRLKLAKIQQYIDDALEGLLS